MGFAGNFTLCGRHYEVAFLVATIICSYPKWPSIIIQTSEMSKSNQVIDSIFQYYTMLGPVWMFLVNG